jgi:hypothetical protein
MMQQNPTRGLIRVVDRAQTSDYRLPKQLSSYLIYKYLIRPIVRNLVLYIRRHATNLQIPNIC